MKRMEVRDDENAAHLLGTLPTPECVRVGDILTFELQEKTRRYSNARTRPATALIELEVCEWKQARVRKMALRGKGVTVDLLQLVHGFVRDGDCA